VGKQRSSEGRREVIDMGAAGDKKSRISETGSQKVREMLRIDG
jgi:hypothetical protein